MAYLAIKQRFIKLTGRHDLVVDTTNYVSATIYGVDEVIQAGQRILDSMTSRRKEFSWERKDIAAGDIKLDISNTTSVKEVWLVNAAGKTPLEKDSLGKIRETYGKPKADLTQGKPEFWTLAVNNLSPNQESLTAVGGSSPFTAQFTFDSDDLIFGDHFAQNTVLFFPASDAVYTLSVLARFFEKTLVVNTDINYWTEIYPDILIKAGMLVLEGDYRNTEGERNQLATIQSRLRGLENDLIDEQISGRTQQAG